MSRKVVSLLEVRPRTEFRDKLQSLRIDRGLSKRKVSRLLGIPYTSYIDYENNVKIPKLSIVYKLSEIYKVNASYLVDDIPYPQRIIKPKF